MNLLQHSTVGPNPVDRVWQVVSDRRWHTVSEVARTVGLPGVKVAEVVNFLETYGFVQKNGGFRITPESPCPAEIVGALWRMFS